MSILEEIILHKIVAILRGVPPKRLLDVVHALYNGGIRLVEVTLNSEDPFAQIEMLNREFGSKLLIGAGTVLDIQGARGAVNAGAKFLISPVVDIDVIRIAKDHDVVSIPGAYTATEIFFAHKSGGDIVKVFPASDPGYIKGVLAALNHIKLMPTGGVNIDNVRQFQETGCVAFGIGSALVHHVDNFNREYLEGLTVKSQNFVQAIQTK